MRFYTFDVGHGSCSAIHHSNGNISFFDVGSGGPKNFSPGDYLHQINKKEVEYLFVLNFDEDHISGISSIPRPKTFYRNRSIDSNELIEEKKKNDPNAPSAALKEIISIHDGYNTPVPDNEKFDKRFPGISLISYCNNWGTDFRDTNNVSLVVFLYFENLVVCLPGDLEKAGWKKLAQRQDFVDRMANVDVLVAPHHGRSGGFHSDLINKCDFRCVVVSDSRIKYATQEELGNYRNRVSRGVFAPDKTERKIITTRNDGHICLYRDDFGNWKLETDTYVFSF